MTDEEAIIILEEAARTGCPGTYEKQEEWWKTIVLPALSRLTKLAEDYEKVKAERDKWRVMEGERATLSKRWEVRHDKLKAEVEKWKLKVIEAEDEAIEAEAELLHKTQELELARPLLESALIDPASIFDGSGPLLDAALAYRERKGEEGKE